jgi:hypothetical protein
MLCWLGNGKGAYSEWEYCASPASNVNMAGIVASFNAAHLVLGRRRQLLRPLHRLQELVLSRRGRSLGF